MLSLWANWLQLNSQLNSPGVSFWLYRTSNFFTRFHCVPIHLLCPRSNCDSSAANTLRKHYNKPYFLPDDSESSKVDWIFMGSPGYGAPNHVRMVKKWGKYFNGVFCGGGGGGWSLLLEAVPHLQEKKSWEFCFSLPWMEGGLIDHCARIIGVYVNKYNFHRYLDS